MWYFEEYFFQLVIKESATLTLLEFFCLKYSYKDLWMLWGGILFWKNNAKRPNNVLHHISLYMKKHKWALFFADPNLRAAFVKITRPLDSCFTGCKSKLHIVTILLRPLCQYTIVSNSPCYQGRVAFFSVGSCSNRVSSKIPKGRQKKTCFRAVTLYQVKWSEFI